MKLRVSARSTRAVAAGSLLLAGALLAIAACSDDGFKATGKKLVVLGIDGMDPVLLQQFMDEGVMPNFKQLAGDGSFQKLGTSNPPQSPVAWSSFITGMDPGGHGVFDFLHRDPATYAPISSTTIETGSSTTIDLPGDSQMVIPGSSEPVRQGRAFWDLLADHDIRADVYRIPAAYPIQDSSQFTTSDMGTPDLQGGIDGTYYLYSQEIPPNKDVLEDRSRIVRIRNGRFQDVLIGPPDANHDPDAKTGEAVHGTAKFTVDIDPTEPVACITIDGGDTVVVREKEWSPWCRVDFELELFAGMNGMCKFFIQELRPNFRMYVSPMNIDPREPCMPISTPDDEALEVMCEAIGPFYTQGLAEETKALQEGTITDGEFVSQCDDITAERLRMLDYALGRFDDGLLFFYFSSVDLRCHMMWRHIEPGHPARVESEAAQYGDAIRQSYVQMDQALGTIRQRIGRETPILVCSDHGFAPYTRRVNLNRWLHDQGYLVLQDAARKSHEEQLAKDPAASRSFSISDPTAIDRSRTRAYALGFNSIYLNLEGRESEGCVKPGERDALLEEIRGKLLQLVDTEKAAPGAAVPVVVQRVDKREDIYHGACVANAPDLVVGYARGYGASDDTALGTVKLSARVKVVDDNKSRWSGNHLMAPEVVPGILLTNQKVKSEAPWLADLTATMLTFFGVAVPAEMHGKPIF